MIIYLNPTLNNNPSFKYQNSNLKLNFGMARIAYNNPNVIKTRLATNAKKTVPYNILKKFLNDLREQLSQPICKFDTPEIISYRLKRWAGKYIRPTSLDAPERTQYKLNAAEKIYSTLYGLDTPIQNKQAFIVFGLPASGKTTTVVEPLKKDFKALVFDGDRSREILPEYKEQQVNPHFKTELKEVEEIAIEKAIENGDNFIHNIVYREKNCKPLENYLTKLKNAGYSVCLVLADISPQKAAVRAKKRFEDTGRFIDPYEILSMGNKYRELYLRLKKKGIFDRYIRYSTDVPLGQDAKKLEDVSGLKLE